VERNRQQTVCFREHRAENWSASRGTALGGLEVKRASDGSPTAHRLGTV